MNEKCDVIVIGAGLAVFLAAKTVGGNGLEVALPERKSPLTLLPIFSTMYGGLK